MTLMEDMPKLMNERYNLVLRRERWRGIGDGAYMCSGLLLIGVGVCAAFGIAQAPLWVIWVPAAVQGFGFWRWWAAVKRIDAIDGGFRDAVKAAPQPAPKEMVN